MYHKTSYCPQAQKCLAHQSAPMRAPIFARAETPRPKLPPTLGSRCKPTEQARPEDRHLPRPMPTLGGRSTAMARLCSPPLRVVSRSSPFLPQNETLDLSVQIGGRGNVVINTESEPEGRTWAFAVHRSPPPPEGFGRCITPRRIAEVPATRGWLRGTVLASRNPAAR